MRLIFMGTPDFAVPCLRAVCSAGHSVLGVVTRPDKPRGRGRRLQPPPVKQEALTLGLPVWQPEQVRSIVPELVRLEPDVIVVVAYGQILPPEVLEIPRYGCINVHASLLPRYRGAAPIHWAVINGESETGVTTMYMDEGLDTGDIILCRAIEIGEDENVGSVHDRLAVLGAELLVETLELIAGGCAPRIPQNHSDATYAPALTREDEIIDWHKDARQVKNLVRGMDPWPGARTTWGDVILKIWRVELLPGTAPGSPGEVVAADERQGIVVKTGSGLLCVRELQVQGRRRMGAAEFLRGHHLSPGTVLGEHVEGRS